MVGAAIKAPVQRAVAVGRVPRYSKSVFQRSLPIAEALGSDALLAYEMGGAPLPAQHGFPLRLMVCRVGCGPDRELRHLLARNR